MVERLVRIQEVRGSIPLISTKMKKPIGKPKVLKMVCLSAFYYF